MTDKGAQETRPLDGVRVLDFSRVIAGPQCTMMLADLGADVIKVEHPKDGDESRSFRPPSFGGESSFFLSLNRNKRSIALNIATAEGQSVARELAAESDVVVENFRTGIVERWGLDDATLREVNPRLVYCSISGYGRDGPLADRPGYDPVIQAECGMMWVNGDPDGEPVRLGVSLIDLTSGMYAAQAILAALYHRRETGEGQRIDIPLFDTCAAMLIPYASTCLTADADPVRTGNSSAYAQPVGLYRAADGPFILSVARDRMYRQLCEEVLGRPDLYENPNFASNELRARNRLELRDALNEVFAADTRDNWIAAMREVGIPAGPIRSVKDAMRSEEAAARGIVREAPHTEAGTVSVIASPMHFSETPVRDPIGSPLLGEHTEEVLREVAGYDAARIGALRAAGVIASSNHEGNGVEVTTIGD